jgi:hypothetical protein
VRYIDDSSYFFALGMGINNQGVEKGFTGTIANFEVITGNSAASATAYHRASFSCNLTLLIN